jgi:hypothetical protein
VTEFAIFATRFNLARVCVFPRESYHMANTANTIDVYNTACDSGTLSVPG